MCERLPDEEFEQLVERIVRIQRNYERQSGDEWLGSAAGSDPPGDQRMLMAYVIGELCARGRGCRALLRPDR